MALLSDNRSFVGGGVKSQVWILKRGCSSYCGNLSLEIEWQVHWVMNVSAAATAHCRDKAHFCCPCAAATVTGVSVRLIQLPE